MHRHTDNNSEHIYMPGPCPNCNDGCTALCLCIGCDTVLCSSCWDEHNIDASCHLMGLPPKDITYEEEIHELPAYISRS